MITVIYIIYFVDLLFGIWIMGHGFPLPTINHNVFTINNLIRSF